MNTIDRIESLMKQGCLTVTFGVAPSKMLYCQAKQGVKTGANGTFMEVTHQSEGMSLPDCLEQVTRQVEHADNLKAGNLVRLPRGGQG